MSQFGCMQTHDQDDLVNQMLRLVGANMNMSAARFYLEMNQWNVQAAVCSYFDLESANFNLPTMVFLADITIGEGESIPPNTPFIKTWRVENPGPDPWPPGTILRLKKYDKNGINMTFTSSSNCCHHNCKVFFWITACLIRPSASWHSCSTRCHRL